MTLYPNLIIDALRNVKYPGNGKSLVDNEMIEDDIRIDGNKVSFSIIFDKPTDPFVKSVVRSAEAAIKAYISPDVDIKGLPLTEPLPYMKKGTANKNENHIKQHSTQII